MTTATPDALLTLRHINKSYFPDLPIPAHKNAN